MNTSDIASRSNLDKVEFDAWIESSDVRYRRKTFGGLDLDEGQDIDVIISRFIRDKEAKLQINQEKNRILSGMLITSGFNFDGFTITKYSGYISGDHAVQVNRPSQGFWGNTNGNVGTDLLDALTTIRRVALTELKEAAHALGCNAVIGVDFDYLTLDPVTATKQGGTLYLPFLFAVTANGNAVIIEKN